MDMFVILNLEGLLFRWEDLKADQIEVCPVFRREEPNEGIKLVIP